MRVEGDVERAAWVALIVDGRELVAYEGESLAAALFAAGVRRLRASPRAGTPRGMFCLMGVCQECVVIVDGRRALACQEPVRAGMRVRTDAVP
jgi:predicted molibdopterin-dependent oxidoreductase YjgC